jgi:hypothetical protein
MMTRYVLSVLLSLLPVTASSQAEEVTLTVEPTVARPGGSIQLSGTGFSSCRDPDASRPIVIASNLRGIATLSVRGTPGGTFAVLTSVSDDPAPGPHTITASCGVATATATVTVVVENDRTSENPGTGSDGDPAGGNPGAGNGDEPAVTVDPPAARTPTSA